MKKILLMRTLVMRALAIYSKIKWSNDFNYKNFQAQQKSLCPLIAGISKIHIPKNSKWYCRNTADFPLIWVNHGHIITCTLLSAYGVNPTAKFKLQLHLFTIFPYYMESSTVANSPIPDLSWLKRYNVDDVDDIFQVFMTRT